MDTINGGKKRKKKDLDVSSYIKFILFCLEFNFFWFTVGSVGNLQNNTQLGTIWQNSLSTPIPNKPPVVAPSTQINPNTTQIEAINVQQNTLREQIRQSEQNLQAQHSVSS